MYSHYRFERVFIKSLRIFFMVFAVALFLPKVNFHSNVTAGESESYNYGYFLERSRSSELKKTFVNFKIYDSLKMQSYFNFLGDNAHQL